MRGLFRAIVPALGLFLLTGGSVQADGYDVKKLQEYAKNPTVIEAAKAFNGSLGSFRADNGITSVADMKKEVFAYYADDFGKEYKSSTSKVPDLSGVAQKADDEAIALQYYYIIKNPEKTGEKNEFMAADDKSKWTQAHKKYHPLIEKYAHEGNGLYDLFLIDLETGRIVYSVFKEIDFATRLIGGPYAGSGLGKAFQAVKGAADKNFTFTGKQAPYYPSYEDGALFLSVPVYDGDSKVGALIAQLPSW